MYNETKSLALWHFKSWISITQFIYRMSGILLKNLVERDKNAWCPWQRIAALSPFYDKWLFPIDLFWRRFTFLSFEHDSGQIIHRVISVCVCAKISSIYANMNLYSKKFHWIFRSFLRRKVQSSMNFFCPSKRIELSLYWLLGMTTTYFLAQLKDALFEESLVWRWMMMPRQWRVMTAEIFQIS